MKKLFIVISALLMLGVSQVRAEQSNSSATGKNYFDNQVFTIAYNNSGATITSNAVVILDTTATVGSNLGGYITTTTSADSVYVFGVTDETILSGESGRVCIRGPHKVWVATNDTSAGDTLGTSTTAQKVETTTATTNKAGQLGVALAGSTIPGDGLDIWWTWVRPTQQ